MEQVLQLSVEAGWFGFYYSRYDTPAEGAAFQNTNYNHKVFFHTLNTTQEHDELVDQRPDQKEWGFQSEVTEDGCYHTLTVWQGTDVRNRLFYQDLGNPDVFVELISELEATYQFAENDASVFYVFTNLDAPRGKLIAIDTGYPQKENWRTIIPEGSLVLEGVVMVNNQLRSL